VDAFIYIKRNKNTLIKPIKWHSLYK